MVNRVLIVEIAALLLACSGGGGDVGDERAARDAGGSDADDGGQVFAVDDSKIGEPCDGPLSCAKGGCTFLPTRGCVVCRVGDVGL